VVSAIALYVLAFPLWQARGDAFLKPRDLYGSRVIDVVIFSWCLWIGSSIGSFLNVVAWRMPRGESINGRSHCPRCMAKLRARDNIPVLGWLYLEGRCWCCRLPISLRYPTVELVVGLSLAAICYGQVYQLSLPRQNTHGFLGPFAAPVLDWRSFSVTTYHLVAVSFSWACGLIRLDGNTLPRPLVGLALAFTAIPLLIDPSLMVVPWQAEMEVGWSPDGRYLDGVMRILTSMVAATVMGRMLVPAFCPTADLKLDPLGKPTARLFDLIVILTLPSLVVGWHSLAAIVILSSVFAALLQPKLDWKKDALGCFSVSVPAAFALQLIFWRSLHAPMGIGGAEDGTWLWPSESGVPWVILSWMGMTLLIPLWLRDFREPSLPLKKPQNVETDDESALQQSLDAEGQGELDCDE